MESLKKEEFVRSDRSDSVEPIRKVDSLTRAGLESGTGPFRGVEPMRGEEREQGVGAFLS